MFFFTVCYTKKKLSVKFTNSEKMELVDILGKQKNRTRKIDPEN